MAESSLGKSIHLGPDQVSELYCQPCFDVNSAIKPVAGYCVDCQESLCLECYTSHILPRPSRNHRLVDKSTRPKSMQQSQRQQQDTREKCPRHHGESIQSFCKSHSQLCCEVCLSINHKTCQTEEISKMAKNIKSSAELKNLNKKISKLKKNFNRNSCKTETIRSTIQRNYSEAIDEMKKLRDKFEKKIAATENLVELVKVEDLKKLDTATDTFNLVIGKINQMTSNLETLQYKGDYERVFIYIKRAEGELRSIEKSLTKLRSDTAVREYMFEPNTKLKALLSEVAVLGRLSDRPLKAVSITQQMTKKPTSVKDITVVDSQLDWHGSVTMSNKQMLVTDKYNQKVKLIETKNGSIVSEIQLTARPWSITKVSSEQVAIALEGPKKIQIISLTQNILSLEREINLNNTCHGIAYNDNTTFIMSCCGQRKLEIINMAGTVLKTIETYGNGSEIFVNPHQVALSPDMSGMYVSDQTKHSVTRLSMSGDVKAVYKDNGLKGPAGMCVHKSGLVYVVGCESHTVHQLNPVSGEFKLLLGQKDGLNMPWSISYCDVEDKIFVGLFKENHLKVFKMK